MPKNPSARLLLIPLLALVVAAVVWRLACPTTHPPPPPSSIDALVERIAPLGLHVTPDPVKQGVWLTQDERPLADFDKLLWQDVSEWEGAAWVGPRRMPKSGVVEGPEKLRVPVGEMELYGDPKLVREIVEAMGR